MLNSRDCDWFVLPPLLATPTIHTSFRLIISDGVKSGIGIKWSRSDSSDSDYIELMTPLTTPIFDFRFSLS